MRQQVVTAMTGLIDTHQSKPGNYFRAINERLASEEAWLTRMRLVEHQKAKSLEYTKREDAEEEERFNGFSRDLVEPCKEHGHDHTKGGKDPIFDQDDESSGIGSMHDSEESSDSEESNCSSDI